VLAWRLCRAPYTDLLGDGARRFGGRWNSPGWPVVYVASNPALAVLEARVHLDLPPELLPDGHVLATVDLGDLSVEDLSQMPAAPRTLSDTWLQEQRTPVLRVPSAIVPESPNLLINPAHPAASTGRVLDARRFTFDPRLWRPR
jgi:RES domain-containing protein